MKLLTQIVCAFVFLVSVAVPVFAAGKAEHIVVVVWDGMRPDLINETNTPTLFKLAHDGVFFQNHHPVYLSSTEVNGTALATGCYPGRSGIYANFDYRPELDPLNKTGVELPTAVRKGDALSDGKYIGVPTVAEIIQQAGFRTVIAGAKGVTLLHDRRPRPDSAEASIDLFEGHTIPAGATQMITQVLGPMPKPGTTRDDWTTRALTGSLWTAAVPKFSLLWLSEPDLSQHRAGPGSELGLTAVRGSDNNLARVLESLTAKGIRDKTDVFVVSDHGFSTAMQSIDVAHELEKAGFNAKRSYKENPTNDDIVVVGNGGSVLLYVIGHSEDVTRRLVSFLQQQDFTGVVLTRRPMQGTFTLDQVKINTPGSPDVVVSMRWTGDKSDAGLPGMIVADGFPPVFNVGLHGSLSRFDLHNTLIAAGPDFRHGMKDALPTSNADVAPTILHLLGIPQPVRMDGRVLLEALTDETPSSSVVKEQTLDASQPFKHGIWHQYLKTSEYDHAFYLDEGNGSVTGPVLP